MTYGEDDFQILLSNEAVENNFISSYTPLLTEFIEGYSYPAGETYVNTSVAKDIHISWDDVPIATFTINDLLIELDPIKQAINVSIMGMAASTAAFTLNAEYTKIKTITCTGDATIQISHYNLSFTMVINLHTWLHSPLLNGICFNGPNIAKNNYLFLYVLLIDHFVCER